MLVSKKAMTMPPCKVTALFETMQYGVHRILTFKHGIFVLYIIVFVLLCGSVYRKKGYFFSEIYF